MSDDLDERVKDVVDALHKARTEFNDASQCCVDTMQDLHERLERLEKWIENEEREKTNR